MKSTKPYNEQTNLVMKWVYDMNRFEKERNLKNGQFFVGNAEYNTMLVRGGLVRVWAYDADFADGYYTVEEVLDMDWFKEAYTLAEALVTERQSHAMYAALFIEANESVEFAPRIYRDVFTMLVETFESHVYRATYAEAYEEFNKRLSAIKHLKAAYNVD